MIALLVLAICLWLLVNVWFLVPGFFQSRTGLAEERQFFATLRVS